MRCYRYDRRMHSHRTTSWLSLVTFLSAATGLFAACSSSDVQPIPSDATCTSDLASIQEAIFAKNCTQAGCHSATDRAAQLDLASTGLEARLVGAPSATCADQVLVDPGHPERSFLFDKIDAETPACGARMPIGKVLSAGELGCVEQWITGLPPSDVPDAGGDGSSCETCGGADCVDLQIDNANCGSCGAACPAGASCNAGTCACSGMLTACGSACVDTSTDIANCGGCDKACPQGSLCADSQCVCPGGLEACGSACVDTKSDAMNCGTCGKACGAGLVCNGGFCTVTCGPLTNCNGSCVDTSTSLTNCGACGKACPAGASCNAGTCACPAGTSACNGTCINTTTDPSNCGACGKVCAMGTTCVDGACACPGGGTSCGNSCVDTQTDPNNCGGCGKTCALGQTCAGGACNCGNASVSFSADVQPILTASCATIGCHRGVMPQEGLDLSTGKSYAGLVNVTAKQCNDGRKRVMPGDPAASYLIDKMMGVDLCFGTAMPKLGGVPNQQITTIANWICGGAPNN